MSEAPAKPKSALARLAPLVLVGAALAAFFALDLDRYVTLETLRANGDALKAFVAREPILAVSGYMAVYALLVAISFPGAGLMTVFGGFLFGLWGAAPTVLAATIGAVLVFLAARTALGGMLRARAGGALARFEDGFRKGEFSYLLILRLVPAFPFWIVNVAPALLGARLGPYAAATLLGIIPGSVVYTSIGAGAAAAFAEGKELTLAGAMTKPEIILPIIGLIALSAVPILARAMRRSPAKAA